jgi:DNA-binding HxlR family transcriptional regulator
MQQLESHLKSDLSSRCTVTEALGVISGKWKLSILLHLRFGGTHRFNELRRLMPSITQKMLTAQLRELEKDGLITRKVYAEVPPRVEYSLSEYGKTLDSVIDSMNRWGQRHAARREALETVQ